MEKLKQIDRNTIINAIEKIESNPELRKGRESTTYDLFYEGKLYPPILVISIANQLKGGYELKLSDFGNKTETPFSILRELGFEIKEKTHNHKKNNREIFKSWLKDTSPKGSNKASSYMSSLDWLSTRYTENNKMSVQTIFEIDDPDEIDPLYKEALKLQRDKESYIYNKKAKSYGDRGFYSASLGKYQEFLKEKLTGRYLEPKKKKTLMNFNIRSFATSLQELGLSYSIYLATRFVVSLLTKPFVILTGLSGSGKTKLAQAFVQWICDDEKQYCLVPVGADWTNREPLLGYPNALTNSDYILPDSGVLQLMIRANNDPDRPYFLILDEMNLSHVERYFADFLSTMESEKQIPLHAKESGLRVAVLSSCEGEEETSKDGIGLIPSALSFPPNLFIIGTVNIDETTHMFSPKVLDRANTIEFRISNTEMESFLAGDYGNVRMEDLEGKGASMGSSFLELYKNRKQAKLDSNLQKSLNDFFRELSKTGAEFGYRTASEIRILLHQLDVITAAPSDETAGEPDQDNVVLDEERMNGATLILGSNDKLDIAVMQKLLPKLHGSRNKLILVLNTLAKLCLDPERNAKEISSFVDERFAKNDDSNHLEALKQEDIVRFPMSFEKIIRMYRNAVENGFTSFAEA